MSTSPRTLAAGLVAALGLLAAGACSDGPPGTVLDGPRVMAVIADPPTVGLGQVATLELVAALDGAPAPVEGATWRACPPWAIIADPVRDCAAGAIPLEVDATGRARFEPAALAEAWGVTPPPSEGDACGERVVDVTVVVEADLAGARLIATKQLEVGSAPPPRRNPVITQVVVDGAAVEDGAVLPAGATVRLTLDVARDSLDLVCEDGADTPTTPEDLDVYVYAGGGATTDDDDIEIVEMEGASVADWVELTLPDAPGDVPLWLVAVDRGGGVAVVRRQLRAE